jgi:hypothetical protein
MSHDPFRDTFRTVLVPFNNILSVGGIAGLIALIITISICYRYVTHGSEPIPDILTYALSTIIGFYFGNAVSTASGAFRRAENSN